jgi:enoyl-CoA hydratase
VQEQEGAGNMDYKYLKVVCNNDHKTATIIINRPAVSNVLNKEALDELQACLRNLEDADSVKVIVITGSGEKAFCGGADISQMQSMDANQAREFAKSGQSTLQIIEDLSKPVIAAINGYAVGGGCELALACDFIFASEKAKIGSPEINLGIVTGWGGARRLPQRVGLCKAKEMLFTGEVIDAPTAYSLGLFTKVFPVETFMDAVNLFAQKLAVKPAIPVKLYKKMLRTNRLLDSEKADALEADLFARCFETEDQKEGMRAFIEKRKPLFKGK